MKYESKIVNLGGEFTNNFYNIPIYQRLYVWEDEQVKLLLDDLISGFKKKDDIYLGNIVVVKKSRDENSYDLIDGQQRFTTLWLLMTYLGNDSFYEKDGKPRLNFSIREDVESFQKELIKNINKDQWKYQTDHQDLKKMLNAVEIFKSHKNELPSNKNDFCNYLLSHVHLIVTEVPENADLNKLFELINGRGIQLQQHEILKAKFIEKIDDDKKIKYGLIWDACSDMDNYIHRNTKDIFESTWREYFNLFGDNGTPEVEKIKLQANENESENSNDQDLNHLNDIENWTASNEPSSSNREIKEQVKSIINFPTLLLYSLAIFKDIDLGELKNEYIDKNLNTIFYNYIEEINAEEFIGHLFKTRVLFDEYVIKFIDISDTEAKTIGLNHIPSIQKIVKQTSGTDISAIWQSRENSWYLLEQLQAMLYHAFTRNRQYWLIPYLQNLVKNDDKKEGYLQSLLMRIEHHLYADLKEENTRLDRAVNFSTIEVTMENTDNIINFLKENDGDNYHRYGQYWFYKMDWILLFLKSKKDLENEVKGKLDNLDKAESFIFTARNSVEHIFAQNNANQEDEKWIHGFGNLALLSSSRNSEYKDNHTEAKFVQFTNYVNKFGRYESLKLALYYKNKDENNYETITENHLRDCLDLVELYYNKHLW